MWRTKLECRMLSPIRMVYFFFPKLRNKPVPPPFLIREHFFSVQTKEAAVWYWFPFPTTIKETIVLIAAALILLAPQAGFTSLDAWIWQFLSHTCMWGRGNHFYERFSCHAINATVIRWQWGLFTQPLMGFSSIRGQIRYIISLHGDHHVRNDLPNGYSRAGDVFVVPRPEPRGYLVNIHRVAQF